MRIHEHLTNNKYCINKIEFAAVFVIEFIEFILVIN